MIVPGHSEEKSWTSLSFSDSPGQMTIAPHTACVLYPRQVVCKTG